MIATAAFATEITAARKADSDARKALTRTIQNCTISPSIQEVAIDRDPIGFAKVYRQVADLMETLPALRARVEETTATLAALEERACYRCDGTGNYSAPTSAYRNGRPYCFKCGGTGEGK
jgi:hypothetical protein